MNNKYMIKNKKNALHYEKRKDADLIELTTVITGTCFMMRPACCECPLSKDSVYCPPAAAHAELIKRGYTKIKIMGEAGMESEYQKKEMK